MLGYKFIVLVINVLLLVSKLIPHCLICENESEPLYSGPVLSNMMLGFAAGRPWTIILKESAFYSLGNVPHHWFGRGGFSSVQFLQCLATSSFTPSGGFLGKCLGEILLVKSFLHHPRGQICGLKPWKLPGWNLKLSPIHGGQEETKARGHSRLGGGRFNRQENFHTRLVFSSHRASGSLHPYARVF